MTNITELTAEKLEEIRQRYRPTLAPKCHICGVEMTIQRMSASRITYGCAGAFYDETGCHYAEGRSLADDHYAESRITVVDVSDPDVLAMVEALEKAQGMEAYWKTQCRGITDHCEELQARIAELESQLKAAENNEIDARCHIADLESRTVKLPKPHAHLIWIQAGHAPDDYWDDVAVSHSEKDLCCDGSERYPVYARWEIEEMLAAAGIKVEAE
ncbi:ead/Ea22-like family protein [Klebsiella pneumoniae]|uniref:ead/Ea22-like family protein n=1 Tax=Klebsiella pneumoniae TaxID=573 RepID=UPI00190E54A6|nr:ead/Ea22-like family protein [Klebsiella pneumoniae]